MGDDGQRQLMAYLQSLQNQQQQGTLGQPNAASQFMPMQQSAPAFMPDAANAQFGFNMFGQPNTMRQQPPQSQPSLFGTQPQIATPQMQQQMAAMRAAVAKGNQAAMAANAVPGLAQGQGQPNMAQGQQLQQLLSYMQNQSAAPGQPPPPRPAMPYPSQAQISSFPGYPTAAQMGQQNVNMAMLKDMMAGGTAANPEQARAMAQLNLQRRGGQAPTPAVPQIAPQPQPQQNYGGQGMAVPMGIPQGANQMPPGNASIATFLRSQNQLRGLQNRVRTLENCLRENVSIVPPVVDGVQQVQRGGQLDMKSRQDYEQQISTDKRSIDALQQSITNYVRNAGGMEVVAAQAQAHLAQLKATNEMAAQQQQAAQQAAQQAQQPPMGVPQFQPQLQPPARPPSVSQQSGTSPSLGHISLPMQSQRFDGDHIQRLYHQYGITAQSFEKAFHEMALKGTVPKLKSTPIINGREVSLYDLLRCVLSAGGSDHLDAKQLWPTVARPFGLFDAVADAKAARETINQLASLYRQFLKPFEVLWATTLTARLASDNSMGRQPAIRSMPMPQPQPSMGQPGQGSMLEAQQQIHQQQQFQMQQQQQQMAQHQQLAQAAQVARTATPPIARASYNPPPPSQQPQLQQQPQQQPQPIAPAPSLSLPTAASTLPPANRPNRMPGPNELREADKVVRQIQEEVRREREAHPLPAVLNLTDTDKQAIKDAMSAMNPLVRKLKELLPLYLCIAGSSHAPAVKRYMVLIFMYAEQGDAMDHDRFIVPLEQLAIIRDNFSEFLTALGARLGPGAASFVTPRPAPTPGASASNDGAERDSIFASLQPGLRREDLKPPPAKHRRTMSQSQPGDSPAAASPAKSAATPEGASPPKTPAGSSVPLRGRQGSARGATMRGRGRGGVAGHSRLSSTTNALPATATSSQPAVVDQAEQRRRQDAANRADPAAFAIEAFGRLQAAEAGAGFGGLSNDLSRQFGFAAPDATFAIAPIVANPPPMPTLSSAAPGWPLASTSSAASAVMAPTRDADEDMFELYLNADACSSPQATTPELIGAGVNGLHESPKDSDEADTLATPQQSTGTAAAAQAAQAKRKREGGPPSSPKPDVPELGIDFSWDELPLTSSVDWSALVC